MLRDGPTTLSGTWKLLDDGRLKVETTVMGSAVTEVYDVTLDCDTATFKDSHGKAQTFNKVKEFISSGPDPQVETIKQMSAELFKPGTRPDPAKIAELRKAEEQLSPTQCQEVGRNRGQQFQQRMNETLTTYFSLSPEKKKEFLDERIKEMEKWRKAREADRAQGGQSGPTGGGDFGGGPGGAGNNDARMARRLQGPDSASPAQRAQWQAFMADMNQRRLELGLPPMGRRPLSPTGSSPAAK